ncbi:tyrosine-type recombinase/integrase [Streptomyces canus]|uniref:tyrosine-type recombinase/integrase n=1 Tax=Streptomyces canus TaxID=58343 RepID=UPI00224EAB56|nr:site-specific integrase [Streptomyces canus]MCX4862124.1 site-specific integrase [Streptomyces canus]
MRGRLVCVRRDRTREPPDPDPGRDRAPGLPHYPQHSMRDTCVSWLVQKDFSLYEVQHLLGHESFQSTQRYAHLQPDAHKAVLGAWERLDVPLTIAA